MAQCHCECGAGPHLGNFSGERWPISYEKWRAEMNVQQIILLTAFMWLRYCEMENGWAFRSYEGDNIEWDRTRTCTTTIRWKSMNELIHPSQRSVRTIEWMDKVVSSHTHTRIHNNNTILSRTSLCLFFFWCYCDNHIILCAAHTLLNAKIILWKSRKFTETETQNFAEHLPLSNRNVQLLLLLGFRTHTQHNTVYLVLSSPPIFLFCCLSLLRYY